LAEAAARIVKFFKTLVAASPAYMKLSKNFFVSPALTLDYNTFMYYVYLIKNELNEIYYGYTRDLRKRVTEHNRGYSFSTKDHRWKLVYYEAYFSKEDAEIREKRLKYHGQALAQLKRRIKNSFASVQS
jgi:predicted GIY-YIG superfamily endonuclease